MNTLKNNPVRFWSKVSGLSLIIMALAAGYAYGFSFLHLYVAGNPEQTLANIQSHHTLFLSGALVWCLILATDLIVSYGFYRYLKPIQKSWAVTSGLLRLLYSLFLAIGILFLFKKDTAIFLRMWSLGLFIIGFHLIATGIGTFYNKKTPKILGIMLIIAGASYSTIHGLQNFMPQAETLATFLESSLAIPMSIGELSFGVWLLFIGGRSITSQLSNDSSQDGL